MKNYSPTKKIIEIKNLETMLDATHISALRRTHAEQLLNALGNYQFPPKLAIRELTANGLDSYFYDEALARSLAQEARTVDITTKDTSITVEDHGLGMDLDRIVYYLLTPSRSSNPSMISPKNANSDVIGRFGQGFLSVLYFLKQPSDKIVVKTKAENSLSITLTIRLLKGQYRVSFALGDKLERGTSIEIASQALSSRKQSVCELVHSVISEYFQFNQRGVIKLNGQIINDLNGIKYEDFSIQKNNLPVPVQVFYRGSILKEGFGRVVLSVNGVKIKDYSFHGYDIFEHVTVNLPSDTALTSDRGGIDYADQDNQRALVEIAQKVFARGLYPLFNSFYPLLSPDYFANSRDLSKPNC